MSDIKAIIFDCDGTLVDSEPITNDVIIGLAAEMGVSLSQHDCQDLFAGRHIACIGEHLASQSGNAMPEDFVSTFRERQSIALERDLRPIEGAIELLEQIERPMFLGLECSAREDLDQFTRQRSTSILSGRTCLQCL